MTLDEAIEMSERIGSGDSERAANNRWLAEQLRLLKFVEETHVIDEAARARREMHEWQLMWKRAETENAKLREQVVQLKNDWESERDYADQMEANEKKVVSENAKLRELCADMWTCIREGEWDCSDCPRYARCNDGVSEFIDRMRELGVEVTE